MPGADIFFLLMPEGGMGVDISSESASLGWEWSSSPLVEGSGERLFTRPNPLD